MSLQSPLLCSLFHTSLNRSFFLLRIKITSDSTRELETILPLTVSIKDNETKTRVMRSEIEFLRQCGAGEGKKSCGEDDMDDGSGM